MSSRRDKFTRALRSTFAPKKSDAVSKTKVFGVPFDRTSHQIPPVIRRVVEYFDHHGVEIEGLFRISGGFNEVQRLIAEFDEGNSPDLIACVDDPHVCASLLKQYLRELPEPLLTFELYDCFLASASVPEEVLGDTIRKVLTMLPMSHRIILKYLVSFLCRVSQSQDINKMTPANIAIVFAPNLLKPEDDDIVTQITDTPYSNKLMELFVQHSDSIFKDEPDIPPLGETADEEDFARTKHQRANSWDLQAGTGQRQQKPLTWSTDTAAHVKIVPPGSSQNKGGDEGGGGGGGPGGAIPQLTAVPQANPATRNLARNKKNRAATAFTCSPLEDLQKQEQQQSSPPAVNRANRPQPPAAVAVAAASQKVASPRENARGGRGGRGSPSVSGRGGGGPPRGSPGPSRGRGRGGPPGGMTRIPGLPSAKSSGAILRGPKKHIPPNKPLPQPQPKGTKSAVHGPGTRPLPPNRSPVQGRMLAQSSEETGQRGRQRSSTTGTAPSFDNMRAEVIAPRITRPQPPRPREC